MILGGIIINVRFARELFSARGYTFVYWGPLKVIAFKIKKKLLTINEDVLQTGVQY